MEMYEKISVDQLENVSGGSEEEIKEIYALLRTKYPNLPEDFREGYSDMDFILMNEYDIDMLGMKTYTNYYRKLVKGIARDEMTHAEVMEYLRANL